MIEGSVGPPMEAGYRNQLRVTVAKNRRNLDKMAGKNSSPWAHVNGERGQRGKNGRVREEEEEGQRVMLNGFYELFSIEVCFFSTLFFVLCAVKEERLKDDWGLLFGCKVRNDNLTWG